MMARTCSQWIDAGVQSSNVEEERKLPEDIEHVHMVWSSFMQKGILE